MTQKLFSSYKSTSGLHNKKNKQFISVTTVTVNPQRSWPGGLMLVNVNSYTATFSKHYRNGNRGGSWWGIRLEITEQNVSFRAAWTDFCCVFASNSESATASENEIKRFKECNFSPEQAHLRYIFKLMFFLYLTS